MQTDQLMGTQMSPAIATGVEFQPLADGTFQIEFFNDDGERLHQQVVDLAVVKSLPVLAQATLIAASVGIVPAVKFLMQLGMADFAFLDATHTTPEPAPE